MTRPWINSDGSVDWQHPDLPDEMLEAETVGLGINSDGTFEYSLVPKEAWGFLRPPERLFLALHFAYRTWKPDEPGGWYRLSSGLYTRASLAGRETRRRAVNTLQERGAIEVRRASTKTTLVRLTNPGPKAVPKSHRKGRTP